MGNSKRNFVAGRMNKMTDERLVPNGEYVDAMNVRLGSTEGSEVGSVESSKGNDMLTAISLGVYGITQYSLSASARCIGAFEDGACETIYWFIHDSDASSTATGKADLIVSYDTKVKSSEYHIVSFQNSEDTLNTTLNFNPKYLITNVNKVGELLFFTDNYNPPRKINVSKNYPYPTGIDSVDEFDYNDLLVVVDPPAQAPLVSAIDSNITDTFMEERFICFGYRYRYADNEYSATSQFTNPSFTPKPFSLSTESYLNDGMVNSSNTADVVFYTGGPQVKAIDILFKESDSSIIKVIECLDKDRLNYSDYTSYTYSFINSKIFTVLSSSEILRLYDNVPLLAKSQTLMGNRIMYGNYVDGYDLARDGIGTRLNYSIDTTNTNIELSELTSSVASKTYAIDSAESSNGTVIVDLEPVSNNLTKGAVISFSFTVTGGTFSGIPDDPETTTSGLEVGFTYRLLQDFANVSDLVTSPDFQSKIGVEGAIEAVDSSCDGSTFTDVFNCALPSSLSDFSKFESGITASLQPITAVVSGNSLSITILAMGYTTDIATPTAANSVYEYYDISLAEFYFQEVGSPTSLHSNRGYEVGIVYMDEFNRATTALVSPQNTVYIPCSASTTQNKIKVNIPTSQLAPDFASRYKFVIKPDGENYETIYSQLYFVDPADNSTYFKLEGENIAKVEEGDRYIIKRDSQGAMGNCAIATVLEKKSQENDFISPVDGDDNVVPTPSGVYMKMFANDFSTVLGDDATILPGRQHAEENSGGEIVYLQYKGFGTEDESGNFDNLDIPSGSIIKIDFDLYRNEHGSGNSCEYRSYKLKREFVSSNEYANIIDWWNGDNIGSIINTGTKSPTSINNIYNSDLAIDEGDIDAFEDSGSLGTNHYRWYKDETTSEIRFLMSGTKSCSGSGSDANIRATFEVYRAQNLIVFETEPVESLPEIWYEGQDSYPIDTTTGYHLDGGNFANAEDQDQTSTLPAILHLNFSNCYTFGNGVESFTIRDSVKGKAMRIGNRVTTVSAQETKESHRKTDITYSGIYNDETNLNRLNEFNLGLANFKSLEDSFGPINKMYARETDILVLQEDKISYVLSGKNLLSDASGGDVLTSVPEVLGKQIARLENYGISDNTESFAAYGHDKFFTDAKRGAVIQLKGGGHANESLTVISDMGMRSWFRDLFTESFDTQKLGAYDPYMNEYVLSNNDISLPSEDECIPCGQKQSFVLNDDDSLSYCIDMPTTLGLVDFAFQVPIAAPVNLEVTWDGIVQINDEMSGLGTHSFDKDKQLPSKVYVTISKIDGLDATFDITSNCPAGNELTVFDIVLTNNDDSGKTLHHNWSYDSDGLTTYSPEQIINFAENSSDLIFSSTYESSTGEQGDGNIPIKGNTVTMTTNKWTSDDYSNSAGDRFMYVSTSTLYPNTAEGLSDLLDDIAGGGVGRGTLTPTVDYSRYHAEFLLYDGVYDYIYLVWDLRTINPTLLCHQAGDESSANLEEVCCQCACVSATSQYMVSNTGSSTVLVLYNNGVDDTTLLGNTSQLICSTTRPTFTPTSAEGVTITIKECDC